jgi:hypothetical protein
MADQNRRTASESLWVLTGAPISLAMARQPIEAQLPVGAPAAQIA